MGLTLCHSAAIWGTTPANRTVGRRPRYIFPGPSYDSFTTTSIAYVALINPASPAAHASNTGTLSAALRIVFHAG
jgi:hypothetical protein